MRINYGRRSKKGLVTTICATVLLSFPGAPLARANKPWTWQQRVTALAAFVESAPSGSFGVSRARDSIVAIDQQSNEFTLIDRLRWQVRYKKSFKQLPVVRRSVPKVQSNADAVAALLIYLTKQELKVANFRSFDVISLPNKDGYVVRARFESDEKYWRYVAQVSRKGTVRLLGDRGGPNTHLQVQSFVAALCELTPRDFDKGPIQLLSTVVPGGIHVIARRESGRDVLLQKDIEKHALPSRLLQGKELSGTPQAAAFIVERVLGRSLTDDQGVRYITISCRRKAEDVFEVFSFTDGDISTSFSAKVDVKKRILQGPDFTD